MVAPSTFGKPFDAKHDFADCQHAQIKPLVFNRSKPAGDALVRPALCAFRDCHGIQKKVHFDLARPLRRSRMPSRSTPRKGDDCISLRNPPVDFFPARALRTMITAVGTPLTVIVCGSRSTDWITSPNLVLASCRDHCVTIASFAVAAARRSRSFFRPDA